jgi:hypothetical protein
VSATSWGVLVIVVASLTVLAILSVGLVRQVKDLASTLGAFRERIQPLVERIGRDGGVAQEHIEQVSAAMRTMQASRAAGSDGAPPDGSAAPHGRSTAADGG